MSNADIARKFKVSRQAVYSRRKRLKEKGLAQDVSEIVEERASEHRERKNINTTKRDNRALLDRVEELEAEQEAMRELAGAQHSAKIIPKRANSKGEATAVCLLSDWHSEEEVKPEWVNDTNVFNLGIAEYRAHECFQKIVKLIRKEQQDVSISELVLWLGGDFITGRIHEENLETCQLQPIQATIFVQELLQAGIEYLLNNTKLNLTIPCSVGNHSRITMKTRSSTERDNSLEYIMYYQLAQRFKGESRVRFIINDSYFTYLTVYNTVLRFHHGTRIRSYGAIAGIHTGTQKAIRVANQAYRADLDLFGHHHQLINNAHSGGFVANGSLIGNTPYGMQFGHQPPRQALFLLDKEHGVTIDMPIIFSK